MLLWQWGSLITDTVFKRKYESKRSVKCEPIHASRNKKFFQNINAALEKTTMFNTTCATWNMIINSIDHFQGLSQCLQLKGSYLGSSVIGSSLGFSVIGSSIGFFVIGMP